MKLPVFENYGQYSSDNYGMHTLKFIVNGNSFYYSYKTLIAFHTSKTGLVIRENEWKQTTGKHLNWIDSDKKKRVSGDEFQRIYDVTFSNVQSVRNNNA